MRVVSARRILCGLSLLLESNELSILLGSSESLSILLCSYDVCHCHLALMRVVPAILGIHYLTLFGSSSNEGCLHYMALTRIVSLSLSGGQVAAQDEWNERLLRLSVPRLQLLQHLSHLAVSAQGLEVGMEGSDELAAL